MTAVSWHALLGAWITVIGAAVGSFLNVVIYRLPRGYRVSLPSRSACTACKRRLAWFENVPVVSYLALRGRCRGCGTVISPRYPIVEILSASLFFAVYRHFGVTPATLYFCVFAAALLATTFIDLDHRIIPDVISIPGVVLGIAFSFAVPDHGWTWSAVGAASGGLLFWFLAWGYERATGREGLGMGDVKLLAMIGAFLGPMGMLGTVVISSFIGSIVGVTVIVAQKKTLKHALPYGPFLAIGALTYLFWGDWLALRAYE